MVGTPEASTNCNRTDGTQLTTFTLTGAAKTGYCRVKSTSRCAPTARGGVIRLTRAVAQTLVFPAWSCENWFWDPNGFFPIGSETAMLAPDTMASDVSVFSRAALVTTLLRVRGLVREPKAAGTAVAAAGSAAAAGNPLSERSQSNSWPPEKVNLRSRPR